MAITIPDRKQIRPTTDNNAGNSGQYIPCVSKNAMTNPGPVVVDSGGPNSAGQPQVVPATKTTRGGYVGFNIIPNVRAGGVPGVFKGMIVDGFAGVTPGAAVFLDATTADATGTASGLTHTDTDTVGPGGRVGVGWTANRIRFD